MVAVHGRRQERLLHARGSRAGHVRLLLPAQQRLHDFRDEQRRDRDERRRGRVVLARADALERRGGRRGVGRVDGAVRSSSTDWIGLYTVGSADTAYLWYAYTNGATSGTLHTTAQGAAGTQFQFRYFLDNGYTKEATSNTGTATAIAPACLASGQTMSNVKHLVVVVMENHTFDSYFGDYCTAATGFEPDVHDRAGVLRGGAEDRLEHSPLDLDDSENSAYDPNHGQSCELSEEDNGLMDKYVTGASCSSASNFAYSDATTMATYWGYAQSYAMADRYFQPAAGASSENDMYLARGAFVFVDNSWVPPTAGSGCYAASERKSYPEPTVGDLLEACSVSWSFYAQGYAHALANPTSSSYCWPDYYDPSDNPFEYYPPFQDNPTYEKDYDTRFASDVANGTLPAVSYIKPLGTSTEHPAGSPQQRGLVREGRREHHPRVLDVRE